MKSLDRQLKFIVLVMLNVEICARVNIPIYCTKLADFSMQNLADAGVSGSYWDSDVKKETETFVAHLIFM